MNSFLFPFLLTCWCCPVSLTSLERAFDCLLSNRPNSIDITLDIAVNAVLLNNLNVFSEVSFNRLIISLLLSSVKLS